MFFSHWSGSRKSSSPQPQRPGPAGRRLCLEPLEDRVLLSGPGGGLAPLATGSGSSQGQPVAVLNQGGPGPSGGSNSGSAGISGPGYPLAPAVGPTGSPSAGQSVVLVPFSGSPGGSGPTFALIPMLVTLGGPCNDPTILSPPVSPSGGTPGGPGGG
jgi:general secretion pathway protein D